MKWLKPLSLCLSLLLLAACGGGDSSSDTNPSSTRSFYMGFTPWPYDATVEAVDTTYLKIQAHGDMIDHQIMQGIPWQQAYDQTAYPAAVENELASRVDRLTDGQVVFLAVDSLNGARDGLANNWGASGEEPRPAPWDGRDFDSPEVITAYSHFALDLIGRFKPRYFNYATEASVLLEKDPAAFTRFKTFARAVYANIKAVHPDLKLMISVSLKSPGSSEMVQLKSQLADLLDVVDVIGVSVYPYIFFSHANKGDPANLPDDWLAQISQIAPGKPVAITETGWIAEDLVISAFGVNVAADTTAQRLYVEMLLRESQRLDMEFVIWWSLIDFQAFWEGALMQNDLAAIWRDIGLYDESVTARPALTVWDDYLARAKR